MMYSLSLTCVHWALIGSMSFTFLAIACGILLFVKGNPFEWRHSKKLMKFRLFMQGISLALFATSFAIDLLR